MTCALFSRFERQGKPFGLVYVIFVMLACAPRRAAAHELVVDELRLWRTPDGSALHAEVTLDPELTRSIDAVLERSKHKALVERFVDEEVTLNVNDVPCRPSIDVRELYERGGAASGDVVMLVCSAAPGVATVQVTLGQRLPALLVSAVGLEDANGQGAALVNRGESARYTVRPVARLPALSTNTSVDKALDPSNEPLGGASRHTNTIGQFFRLGFRHVLPEGFDHLLFVFAMSLVAYTSLRRLGVLVAVFTAAHTLSVGWVWFGGPQPSAMLIEPLITTTIAAAGLGGYLQLRWDRVVPVVGLFGIIHGLGFANSLAPKIVDHAALFTALIGFNLGVELAHLIVAGVTVGLLRITSRSNSRWQESVKQGARWVALCVAVLAIFWTVTRVFVRA
jgi:hypothetical protein